MKSTEFDISGMSGFVRGGGVATLHYRMPKARIHHHKDNILIRLQEHRFAIIHIIKQELERS